jgi:hypothetical protein
MVARVSDVSWFLVVVNQISIPAIILSISAYGKEGAATARDIGYVRLLMDKSYHQRLQEQKRATIIMTIRLETKEETETIRTVAREHQIVRPYQCC